MTSPGYWFLWEYRFWTLKVCLLGMLRQCKSRQILEFVNVIIMQDLWVTNKVPSSTSHEHHS